MSTTRKAIASGWWHELRSEELCAFDVERTVAVLPVAAIEQHGPHLPLGTDAMINDGVVRRALQLVPGEATVLVLPAMNVGDSLEHTAFEGTLSIDAQVLLQSWIDIARSVERSGVRKLLVLNSHGGQVPLVDLLAVRMRAECKMLVARVNTFRLGVPAGLFSVDELAHGLHGGEVETSLMLHLHPDLVRLERAQNFSSLAAQWSADGRSLGVEKPAGIGWMAQDVNESGVCGNAAAADADRGAQLLEHLAQAVSQIAVEMSQTSLDVLRDRPARR